MQVDGEPFMQGPCTASVRFVRQVPLLARAVPSRGLSPGAGTGRSPAQQAEGAGGVGARAASPALGDDAEPTLATLDAGPCRSARGQGQGAPSPLRRRALSTEDDPEVGAQRRLACRELVHWAQTSGRIGRDQAREMLQRANQVG